MVMVVVMVTCFNGPNEGQNGECCYNYFLHVHFSF